MVMSVEGSCMAEEDEFASEICGLVERVFDNEVAGAVVSCDALPALVNKLRGVSGGNAALAAPALGRVHELLSADAGLTEWLVGSANAPAAWVASRVY